MRSLDKVIGYNPIKNELYRFIDVLNNPDKYAKLGVNIPKGILFEGAPGIGKTLMAMSFMEECNRKSYIIRKDKPDGVFVDYIREIFEEARKNAPAIILLDDMDKFANEGCSKRDAEEYVTVQACIDSVKKENVFVIATVNNTRNLPDSLLRSGRFDKIFLMHFPKGEDAKRIIKFYIEDKKCEENVDVEEISRFTSGYSCADLETAINEAGLYAVYEDRKLISQEDLKKAFLRKFYGISDDEEEIAEDIIRRRVIHEAGHAVVAELCDPGSVNFVSVSTKKVGIVGGFVSREYIDGYHMSFENNEKEVMISVAGKAAVEIVLGEIDMGAHKDMYKAFDETRRLLDDHVSYDFNSWCHGNETSENVYEHLDSVTGAEVSRYYFKAKQLLLMNREFLNVVIGKLLDKKTLSYKDIAKIRAEGGF